MIPDQPKFTHCVPIDLPVDTRRGVGKINNLGVPFEAFDDLNAFTPVKIQSRHVPRILLVDDDLLIRRLYSEVLISSGYQVDTAEDGEAAWNLLALWHEPGSYDLLITDNDLPKLSGVELINKLWSAHMALPVMMATSTTPPNIEELHLAAMLTKPFFPDQLVQAVQQALHWSASFTIRYHDAPTTKTNK